MGARLEPVMSRPIRATILPAALRHNYAAAKKAAPGSRVYAVVKANAYGHGIERVARALTGADGFATLELDGALMLREQFPAAPVLLLDDALSELDPVVRDNVLREVQAAEQVFLTSPDSLPVSGAARWVVESGGIAAA